MITTISCSWCRLLTTELQSIIDQWDATPWQQLRQWERRHLAHARRTLAVGHGYDVPALAVVEADVNFWSKVEYTHTCWLWRAGIDAAGYGRFNDGDGIVQAHRHAYTTIVGAIPDTLVLDHLCRTPACVRNTHLEVVTLRINTLRGDSFSAVNAQRTHCVNGHLFDEANTWWRVHPNGRQSRRCRTCHRERERRYSREIMEGQ